MMGLLDQAGADMTNAPETADILVVNTCAFIDKAKQESIDTILQMAAVQGCRESPQADRCRLHGGAVPGRDPKEPARGGCGCRHW